MSGRAGRRGLVQGGVDVIRYSSEVSIARPPHDVFEALLDPKKYERWTEMTDVRFEAAAPQVGTRGSFRLAKGPIKGVLDMEITAMEPDRRLVVRVTHSALDWLSTTTLEPIGDGTKMSNAGEITLKGWQRLAEPLMAGELRAGEAKEAERFKALLESEGSTSLAGAGSA